MEKTITNLYGNGINSKKNDHVISPRKTINTFLIVIYTFNAIFISYDNFGLKKLSFILLVILNIDRLLNSFRKKGVYRMVLLFGMFLPIYTILKSSLFTGNFIADFLYGYTGMILLLYIIIDKDGIDFIKIIMINLFLLAVFIDLCALFDFAGIMSIYRNPILVWMDLSESADVGKGGFYLLGYYIFVKTSPMLLLGLGYYTEKRNIFISVVILLALFLSGTRANAILGILAFGVCLMINEKNTFRRLLMVAIVVASAFYILFGQDMLNKYLLYASSKIGGDAVRAGTLPSIFKSWKDDPLSFFVGQGYSSSFYNLGRMSYTSDVELSYWNLLRRVGLFCFVLFMVGYFYPLIKYIKIKRRYVMPIFYLAYLVGAYINPLLYTSSGVTVLLLMYVMAYEKQCISESSNPPVILERM